MSQQVHTNPHQDPSPNPTPCARAFPTTTGQLDHEFFGLSEPDVSIIDPRHVMLLHTAWECLYNSGHGNPLIAVKGHEWGIFVGMSHTQYIHSEAILTSNAANEIARVFDLVGPTLTVDSSLCALDAACMSLNAGNCTAALVSGVDARLTATRELLDNSHTHSTATGNEGSSAVLLMPLDKASREGKRIYAVIKSTATNNNGATPTFPPPTKTQTRLLDKALAKSNIDPSTMLYIEANTSNPSELQAIENVYGSKLATGSDHRTIYLGSLNATTCIGHLEAGAGLARLVKTVLVLEHSQIPGNSCLTETNQISCTSHSIHRPTANVTDEAFPATVKMCAIVNSFQWHGSNATAIVQQYTALPHMTGVRGGLLLLTDTIISANLYEISKTISILEGTFPQFLQANKVHKKIYRLTKELAVFKLLRAMTTILTALGVHFNIMGGVDILGEILTLSITGAIKDSQAMKLIRTGKSGSNYPTTASIQDSITKPSTSIFSCVLEKTCYPSEYKTDIKSKKYAQKFLSMLKGECSTSSKRKTVTKALMIMSSQTTDNQPLLALIMDATAGQLTEIKQTIPDSTILMRLDNSTNTQYIRQKCMELRDLSDVLKLKACTNKPSRGSAQHPLC